MALSIGAGMWGRWLRRLAYSTRAQRGQVAFLGLIKRAGSWAVLAMVGRVAAIVVALL